MNVDVERYRSKASKCEEHAKETLDPIARERFIDTARGWRELAEQAEHGRVLKTGR
jgi:hypothetical protein